MPEKHAFLCYSHEDTHAVDWLEHELEAGGVSVWRDTTQLWPGENWQKKIQRAITDNALVFVACFSRASVVRDTSFQNEELALAVAEFRKRRPDLPWLIPVRLDDCQLPDLDLAPGMTLDSLHRADVFGARRDQELKRLVGAITSIFRSSQARPEASGEVQERSRPQVPRPPSAGSRVSLAMPGSRAVVIGASSYVCEDLGNVPAVMDTVSDLRQALIDRCGIPRDRVRFMPDWPDASSVGAALAREAERTEGVLVVYYAGYGLIGRGSEFYLAVGQTDPAPGQLEHTALAYAAIRRHLQDSPAQAAVVILDCCFGSLAAPRPSMTASDFAALASIDGAVVLTSAARTDQELAPEGQRHTALTGALLRLLTEGDSEGPRELTMRDGYRYVDVRLGGRGRPRPFLFASRDADSVTLAANPAREPRAAPSSARPAATGAPEPAPWPASLVAAATRNYLLWLAEVNNKIQVTGLARSRGSLGVPLERVYTALRLDQSSQTERASAAENLWRELERELLARNLSPQEEDDLRWVLYADLPAADYLGLSSLLASAEAETGRVLHVGEVYQRDSAIVILGDPGSGKTTIAAWLTLLHAQALLRGLPEVKVEQVRVDASADSETDFVLGRPLLPIQVRVAEYAADRQQRRQRGEQPRGLREFLGYHSWNQRYPTWAQDVPGCHRGERIAPDLLAGILETALRERRALVVLDGLDEVPAEERTVVADAITEFITRWMPYRAGARESSKVIVTSRVAGYQLAPLPADLTQVTIEKMTDEALRIFVHNWMRAVLLELADGEDAEALADDLIGLLGLPGNRYIRDLATNPMLAAVIVSVFINQGNALPSQRVEVYQSAVDTLIEVWSARLSGTYDKIESLALFAALPAVAAHVHATKANGVILAAEFRDHLLEEVARIDGTNPQEPSPSLQASVESLLRIMRVELGLLVESGPGAFRFSHLTFQEFLAARHLVSDSGRRAARILSRLGDPRWREPILMALALINWQHPGQVGPLVTDLLAADSPLGDLFPESALLLAAAIPQMTRVTAEVVQPVVMKLLLSYSTLTRQGRLPRVRELIEGAVAALRSEDHEAGIDDVLASALTRPGDGGQELACATALLIQTIDARSPRLAVALAEAAGAWDSLDLGSPITQALTVLISPAEIPEEGEPVPRLEPGWGSGLLPMRELLRRRPELTDRIRRSPRWMSLMLCLYGGYWYLGAADALDEYQRIAHYLQLADERSAFEAYFGLLWGRDDPVYSMAVYLDTVGKELQRKWQAAPLFSPDAIIRDSPFTWPVTQALSADDLPGLTRFLRGRAEAADPVQRQEAVLALWALGEDPGPALSGVRPGEEVVARRAGALEVGLRDCAVQAAAQTAGSLARLAGSLPNDRWERLFTAVQAVLIQSGAGPVTLGKAINQIPEQERARVFGEELTQWVRGFSDDVVYSAAVFADAVDPDSYPPELVIAAVNSRGTGGANEFRRYAHWWPADPLTLPYNGEEDIPIHVLDQLLSVPQEMAFVPGWLFELVVSPMIERNPALKPEVLVIAWAAGPAWDQDFRERTLETLDESLATDIDPVARLMRSCQATGDPWHQARGFLRIADCFPDHAAEAIGAAAKAAALVTDHARSFQLRERLARLAPAPERARHLAQCPELAAAIGDPVTATVARLRLAAASPASECEDQVLAALGQLSGYDSRQDQLRTLQLILENFPDCVRAKAAAQEMLTSADFATEERAWVLRRWGSIIVPYLPELAGTDPGAVQAWAPLALYALAGDLSRSGSRDESNAAWRRLATGPSPETVAQLLAWYGSALIDCTGAVARSLSLALDALDGAPATVLRPLLGRLVRASYDAEPALWSWHEHADPDVSRVAALLLAEHRGMSATLVPAILGLLDAEDDLSRGRARRLTGFGGNYLRTTVSRLGRAGIDVLAQFYFDRRVDSPGAAVAVTWCLEGVVHDDPGAILAWCAELEASPTPDSGAGRVLEMMHGLADAAWTVLLDRLRNGSAVVQARLLRACAVVLWRSWDVKADPPDFSETAAPFRIDGERWRELWDVLREIDPESLRDRPVLSADVEMVLAAAAASLAATGGHLDQDSARRASGQLWELAVSSVGDMLAAGGEIEVREALSRYGQTQLASVDGEARAVGALEAHRAVAGRSEWPWVTVLTDWVTELLAQSVRDEANLLERSYVIEAAAPIVVLNPDTFRRRADTETLSRLLAMATQYHNGFPGRRGAAKLLGVLRHGSAPVLRSLQQALLDVPQVREAALESIPQLRNVDQAVVDQLIAALSGRSAIAAWAAAQLLTIIGQNASTPFGQRQRIIGALVSAIQDPSSRRSVFFAFTQAAIPEMPSLDDIFAESIQKIYRFG